MTLVLASGSATRQGMLAAAGVAFAVDPADLDEAAIMNAMAGQPADAVALRLARAKALAVSARHPGRIVLGADTVLAFQDRLLAKAPDMAAARALLRDLRGRSHHLASAAVLARDGMEVWSHAATVRLDMRAVSDAFLDDYLAAEGPAILSSVGCYHYEGRGAQLFEAVDGDYFAVLGLPLLAVLTALRAHGILAA